MSTAALGVAAPFGAAISFFVEKPPQEYILRRFLWMEGPWMSASHGAVNDHLYGIADLELRQVGLDLLVCENLN